MMGAFNLSLLPILLCGRLYFSDPPTFYILAAIFGIIGTFFFPAIFLTLATSGTSINLRPDRVWGVIRQCGPSYLAVVVLFALTLITYGWGIFGSRFSMLSQVGLFSQVDPGI